MDDPSLDSVYTDLAQAIQASGARSELYLAMLSLRLIARAGDWPAAQDAIRRTLEDLAAHDAASNPSLSQLFNKGDLP